MPYLYRLLCATIIAALSVASLVPVQEARAAGNPEYCASTVEPLDNKKFGTDIPVLFVHGLNGDRTSWGSNGTAGSFYNVIDSMPFVAVAQSFNYDATYPGLITADTLIPAAEKLAATIECVGKLSAKNGGSGKVVVMAYSLGGLVSRLAFSQVPTTKRAWKYVSKVVTIGTPHKGLIDPLTQIYTDALPKFPGSIDAIAIAGSVTRIEHKNNGQTKVTKVNGDGLIPVKSAINGYVKAGSGSHWTHTYQCDQEFNQGEAPPVVGCSHDRLIQDPSNGMSRLVGNALLEYIENASQNNPPGDYTVGDLTLTMNDSWTDASYGAGWIGVDMFATDTTNVAPCTNCDVDPAPMVPASIFAYYYGMNCGGTAEQCVGSQLDYRGTAPKMKVGGKTPDYSAKYQVAGYPEKTWGYVWCFETEKVCVYYDRGLHDKTFKPSDALRQLLADAKWAK